MFVVAAQPQTILQIVNSSLLASERVDTVKTSDPYENKNQTDNQPWLFFAILMNNLVNFMAALVITIIY